MNQAMNIIPRRAILACLLASSVAATGLLAAPWAALAADEASPWSKAAQSSVRLISGGAAQAGGWRAGVEIRLAPGYKTYWRTAGDSGIPPRFDWSGSGNLASVEVKWPVPTRFSDGSGSSIGYVGDVVFPLVVTAVDPSRPVTLNLKLDYAVCEKLCIPAQGAARLDVTQSQTRFTARIAGAEAQVPLRAGFGPHPERPALIKAATGMASGKPVLNFTFKAPMAIQIADVLVEGPDMWVFGASSISQESGGFWHAAIALEDRPRAEGGLTPLLVTIIGNGQPFEIPLDLDIALATP